MKQSLRQQTLVKQDMIFLVTSTRCTTIMEEVFHEYPKQDSMRTTTSLIQCAMNNRLLPILRSGKRETINDAPSSR